MPNFLDLPAELRVKIYRNLYIVGTVDLTDNTFSSIDYHRALNPSQCHFCPTSLKKAKTSGRPYILAATEARRFLENEFIETFCFASSQFLRCSKLVYHESMPILYSENTFWLTNACQLRNFLRDCSDVARYSISSLLFQHASRFNLVPSRGGPESKLLPNLKKLQFYASSHSERPHHCPSTEWDGLLIDTTPKGEDDPNGKDEWAKALRKGNPGDEFLRRLYKKHPSVQCGILVEQYVGRLSINQDYWRAKGIDPNHSSTPRVPHLVRFKFVVENGETSKRTFTLQHDDTFPAEKFIAEHAQKNNEFRRLRALYYSIPSSQQWGQTQREMLWTEFGADLLSTDKGREKILKN